MSQSHDKFNGSKVLRFSLKYRPDFIRQLSSKRELTTTRLFDDKRLSVGDTVAIVVAETGQSVARGVVSGVKVASFSGLFKSANDLVGTFAMYADYYGRRIRATTRVKDVTITLIPLEREV